ncbi:MAG: hypothetical protein M3467_05250 [Actinomycetota bacterium]|nr:hypothetical protein [Actinomycetota bacterium]
MLATSGIAMVDDEVLVACGDIRPAFTVSAMREGITGLADDAEVAAALDDLREVAGMDAPQVLQGTAASQAHGTGPRLFEDDAARVSLSLATCEAYDNGVVYLAYRPQV